MSPSDRPTDAFQRLRQQRTELQTVDIKAIPDAVGNAVVALREALDQLLLAQAIAAEATEQKPVTDVQPIISAEAVHMELMGDAYCTVGDLERAYECYKKAACKEKWEQVCYRALIGRNISLARTGFSSMENVPEETRNRLGNILLEEEDFFHALEWSLKMQQPDHKQLLKCVQGCIAHPHHAMDTLTLLKASMLIGYDEGQRHWSKKALEEHSLFVRDGYEIIFNALVKFQDHEGLLKLADKCIEDYSSKEGFEFYMRCYRELQIDPPILKLEEYAKAKRDFAMLERVAGRDGLITYGKEIDRWETTIPCLLQAKAYDEMKEQLKAYKRTDEQWAACAKRDLLVLESFECIGEKGKLKKIGNILAAENELPAIRAYMMADEVDLASQCVKQWETDKRYALAAKGYAILNEKQKAKEIAESLMKRGADHEQLEAALDILLYLEDEAAQKVADRLLRMGQYYAAEKSYKILKKEIPVRLRIACADKLFASGDTYLGEKLYVEIETPIPSELWIAAGDALLQREKMEILEVIDAYTKGESIEKLIAFGTELLSRISSKNFPISDISYPRGEEKKIERYTTESLRRWSSVCFEHAAKLRVDSAIMERGRQS